MKKIIVISVIALLALLGMGSYYFYSTRHPSTEDAYIHANVISIAPQVSGQVQAVYVQDQMPVHKNQLLLILDPRPYDYQLEQAQASLALQRYTLIKSAASYHIALANLQNQTAALSIASSQANRTLPLVAQGLESPQIGDNTEGALQEAAAAVRSATANLLAAKAAYHAQEAALRMDQAALKLAAYNLEQTQIRAPASGTLSQFASRPGDAVESGVPIFFLIERNSAWINAHFKEDQIARIRPGNLAYFSLDLYPGHTWKGRVESLSAGSGSSFSLLPSENATGNWVKVPQRFTVRIEIPTKDFTPNMPFRLGASVDIRVDTEA